MLDGVLCVFADDDIAVGGVQRLWVSVGCRRREAVVGALLDEPRDLGHGHL